MTSFAFTHKNFMQRLFDYYLSALAECVDQVWPFQRSDEAGTPGSDLSRPPIPDLASARAWLDSEHGNLIAICASAADSWPEYSIRLAELLFKHLYDDGYYSDAITVTHSARTAATTIGDQYSHAKAVANLGNIFGRLGQYEEASTYLHEALAIYRALGAQHNIAHTLNSLGFINNRIQRYDAAIDQLRQALALFNATADHSGEGHVLNNLGVQLQQLGQLDEALDNYQQALALFRGIAHSGGEAKA